MAIPTEPIGSIPRPLKLIEAVSARGGADPALDALYDEAIRDTTERFEATGSPVISDGEQRKYHNFWTCSVDGLPNMAPDGFKIPFSAGPVRSMPRLTAGPFRYRRYADSYIEVAARRARIAQAGGHLAVRPEPLVYRGNPRCDRIIEASEHIPIDQLGTTDDCGFSPFCDDTTNTRDLAFKKIRARVQGTALAAEKLGV